MHTPNTHTPFQDLPDHQGVLCRTRDFSYLGPCTELLGRYGITPLDPFSALPDSPGSFVAQVGMAPSPRGAAIMQRDASPSARGQDPSRGDRGSQMSPQTVRIRVTKKFTRNQNFLSKAILLLKGVLQPVQEVGLLSLTHTQFSLAPLAGVLTFQSVTTRLAKSVRPRETEKGVVGREECRSGWSCGGGTWG